MGLRSLGLAGLGAGLCKRNIVLNILGPSSLIIYSTGKESCIIAIINSYYTGLLGVGQK